MKIGIIGSGNIGSHLGLHLTRAGHEVLFSSRHPETLKKLAQQAGEKASTGTLADAFAFGEIIILAMPFGVIPQLAQQAGDVTGKIVLDVTNYYPQRDGEEPGSIMQEKKLRQSEFTQMHFANAKVVKAFNTIYYVNLKEKAFQPAGQQLGVPYAGNDAKAKATVAQLMKEIGFEGVDIGELADTQKAEPGGALYAKSFTAQQIREKL